MYVDDKQCGQINFEEGKTKYTFRCEGAEGSKVTLKHSGQYINICEMEVLGKLPWQPKITTSLTKHSSVREEDIPSIPVFHNVAAGRPTSQSSTGWGGVASRAVDGNTNSQWSG